MANIKVGDIVKFLDEVGGGKVIKIIDKNTVLVETDDGFEFPYLASKLVVAGAAEENKQQPAESMQEHKHSFSLEEEEQEIIKDTEDTNIYLAFVANNIAQLPESNLDLYLINDSNWHLLYLMQTPHEDKVNSTPGHLQPNLLEYIATYTPAEIAELKEIAIHILFFRKLPHKTKKPLMARIRIKPEKLLNPKSYITNDFFEEKAVLYTILEEDPLKEAIKKLTKKDTEKVARQKEVINKKLNKPRQYKSGKKSELMEIDLHITELLDDTRGMTAKDMLEYQMDVFRKELEEAQKSPIVKKIVFIHGKGNGRLRTEIRAYLDRKKIPYQDASFAKYGFGATMVFVD